MKEERMDKTTLKMARFKAAILDHYRKSGRHDLPWRKTRDPYRILVSEAMLQQTQVSRVLKKYPEFLKAFPNVGALARASVADVLRVWQGLGYNRRALLLKRAAESVMHEHGGKFPRMAAKLELLPGVGQSTRGAIMAFAFGIPTVFIETNIRAVFIHFFFSKDKKDIKDGAKTIHDRDILPLIEMSLEGKGMRDAHDAHRAANPREWYYALMDYGVRLKKTMPNPSRRSAHHVRQSPFKGSNRQVRAAIVRFVLAAGKTGATEKSISAHIAATIGETPHDIRANIRDLVREGFILETAGRFRAY